MNINGFIDAIASAGLGVPDIICDGLLHRFSTPTDKHRNRSGWYVLYGEVGVFGDWRTGLKETWCDRGRKPTAAERRAFAEAAKQAKRERAEAEREKHEATAMKAQEMWSQAAECMWHDYAKRKRILPLGIRQKDDLLLVPMMDTAGKIWSAQTIAKDGSKRFLLGGKKKGCFFLIGGPVTDRFYIVEGYSTGCTVHMHLDPHTPVFVAFDAGNVLPVARSLRRLYPDATVTVACDNDCWGDHNPGLTKGREAAAAVGGELIYPIWDNVDTSTKPTDFNDLHRLGGMRDR